MNVLRILSVLTALAVAPSASAHDYQLGKLKIAHPWARATVPAAQAGGGFMTIENAGEADRLLAVSAEVSEIVELHTMKMEGDVMQMRKVPAIDLPAGGKVELKPGGLHVMFIKLKAPLKAGTRFPATLRFEKAGEVKVEMAVEEMAAAPAHKH